MVKVRIRPRRSWGHAVKHAWALIRGPLTTVYVHHSVTASAGPKASLKADEQTVKSLDTIAHGRGFNGISYNFACTQAGRAFAGRGWKHVGAHNDGENSTTYGIVAIGNFQVYEPSPDLIRAIASVIVAGKRNGHIGRRVRIKGHRDSDSTACPGDKLYAKLWKIKRLVRQEVMSSK